VSLLKVILFLSFYFCSHLIIAQNVIVTIVEKNKYTLDQKPHDSVKLKWIDFKVIVPENSTYFATTFSFTSYNIACRNTAKGPAKLKITTQFYFDKTKSNKKANGQNDYLLSHEQLHFDISWYWYQQLLKELKNTIFDKIKCVAQASEIFKKNQANLMAMQIAYDAETEHSLIDTKQKEWAAKVALLVSEYSY
jgi:hypothetical protein